MMPNRADPSRCELKEAFESTCDSTRGGTLDYERFALMLLSPENRAVPVGAYAADHSQPLAHYWVATSHNSYVIGDQLTGISTADAYRRQLLQGCRHVEIDCWDEQSIASALRLKKREPNVTHGHTFCTVDSFNDVAAGIAETAFKTSDLPVILSMEMHCKRKGQHKIAIALQKHLGERLVKYDDLGSADAASVLSPDDLRGKVLCKGKVKEILKAMARLTSGASLLSADSLDIKDNPSRLAQRVSLQNCPDIDDEDGGRTKEKKIKVKTDKLYGSYLSLRSVPVGGFRAGNRYGFALPITSIGEEKLFQMIGLGELMNNAFGSNLTLVDERRTKMTSAVHAMQRQTVDWLVRPYPLGLRFSGMNIDPLPCWLSGSQHVALNLCNDQPDLPAQLHFALFEDSGGYVLKPSEMRGAEGTTAWPPSRDTLCRVTIELLSVHGLPQLGEERPHLQGVHSASHAYAPWLSGSWKGPVACDPSSPFIKFALHPIGGFCSVSTELPPSHIRSEHVTAAVQQNGLHPRFGETIHCLAAGHTRYSCMWQL